MKGALSVTIMNKEEFVWETIEALVSEALGMVVAL